jgi:hypothetical protein
MKMLGYGVWQWVKAFLLVYFGMLEVVLPPLYVAYPSVAKRFLTFDPTQYIVYTVMIIAMFLFSMLLPVLLMDKYGNLWG